MLTRSAFTLVEILLVLVILGVLAAIVVPKFSGRTEQANQTAAKTQLSTFETALDAFEIDNGHYPESSEGLNALLINSNDAANWRGPYIKGQQLPLDPWGRDYIYEYPGKNNLNGYDLVSMGLDGRSGTEDDITNY